MSEEEQKAINELKEEINRPVEVPEDIFDTYILFNIENSKILLNLIDRLQEELKQEKEKNNKYEKFLSKIEDKDLDIANIRADAILDWDKYWKDKIRDKIKEWDKAIYWNNADDRYYAVKGLENLLKEN